MFVDSKSPFKNACEFKEKMDKRTKKESDENTYPSAQELLNFLNDKKLFPPEDPSKIKYHTLIDSLLEKVIGMQPGVQYPVKNFLLFEQMGYELHLVSDKEPIAYEDNNFGNFIVQECLLKEGGIPIAKFNLLFTKEGNTPIFLKSVLKENLLP